MQPDQIAIYIVDDSEVFRLGISVALDRHGCFDVLKDTPEGSNLVEQICKLNPHVVLIDATMTSSNPMEVIKEVRAQCPSIKFLVLSPQLDSEQIWQAFNAGADGHCTKGIRTEWLLTGIKTLAAGGKWASPQTVEALLSASRVVENQDRFRHKPAKQPNSQLSAREQEVLTLLVQGFSNTEIGARLYLSPETIKTHVRHIMEKLSVRDRTHAAVEAVRRGLVAAC